VTTKPLIMMPDLQIVKFRHRFITCLGSLSAVTLLSPTRRFMRCGFPSSVWSPESGSSDRVWVSIVREEPRRLSPSEAIEKRGHPIIHTSALQASITVEISRACLSQFSHLQVPVTMKGHKPHTCLLSERIPIENTVACQRTHVSM
jgi:hypothetical protein